ncbi:MAG: glutamine--fructose-6-phosphate aminotransferase [Candidatus Altiarchaeales archaeon WOR_SM1_86-2]|nr:MAG: glutamine--fructose-6-phosphate aminotransferase [Candidatus Altiarchaeales archaeon WOR_SM1_86-2]ODS40471.1 MAG: glutamine--fructose-6-phosphate aminotransferase [Candidatus Altiarchaeales archaeon WOR_SM1_79]
MCGIVGYVGERECVPILMDGLRRLEYRGYDSAGISVMDGKKLKIKKTPGRISDLVRKIDQDPEFQNKDLKFNIGIAHTRWATHGEPNEVNAHPHLDCKGEIAVVHNGIVENYAVLKSRLEKWGHTFKSDTDTEVIAHLIEEFYDGNLEKAVESAVRLLEGSYGIGVMSSKEPGKIVAARLGSPLKIGIGKDGHFIASDMPAILPYTRDIIHLNDREIASLTRDGVNIYHMESGPREKKIEKILLDITAVEKNGYPHFMLKEIYEQPETVANTLRGKSRAGGRIGRLVKAVEDAQPEGGLGELGEITEDYLKGIEKIIIIACGTSLYAGLIGEYVIEKLAKIPVEVEYASEFQYRNPVLDKKTMIIAISQSGETADTISSIRRAQIHGAKVFGICNVPGSTIAHETDGGKYTRAGPEIGVASTKAFTAQLAVIYLLAVFLGWMRGNISSREAGKIMDELGKIPEEIKKVLETDDEVVKIANKFYGNRNFLYMGRDLSFPIAMEGALKLKEISYIHAEGYPSGEMKHGPIALIDEDMPVVVIAPKDGVYEKVISNIEEVKARKGVVIAVATEGDKEISKKADHVIYIPKTEEILTPFLSVIPLQLLAYHIGVKRGCDVDKPRNLAKSVTVE